MGEQDLKHYLEKILDKIDNIESAVKEHSKEFTLLHTEISTYHTELVSFSSKVYTIEKDYVSEIRKYSDLSSSIAKHDRSIEEILQVKGQISSCPYCTRYTKSGQSPFPRDMDYGYHA